jgi:hypothetical protein
MRGRSPTTPQLRRFRCQFQVETTTKLDSAQDTQGVFAELVARVPEDAGLEVLPAAVRIDDLTSGFLPAPEDSW